RAGLPPSSRRSARPPSAKCRRRWLYSCSPAGELLGQLLGTLELCPPIELVGVGSMTALDLADALRATSWDSAVQNADILEVPGEVGTELGPVVGLNPLDRRRQASPYLVDESDCRLDRVV